MNEDERNVSMNIKADPQEGFSGADVKVDNIIVTGITQRKRYKVVTLELNKKDIKKIIKLDSIQVILDDPNSQVLGIVGRRFKSNNKAEVTFKVRVVPQKSSGCGCLPGGFVTLLKKLLP